MVVFYKTEYLCETLVNQKYDLFTLLRVLFFFQLCYLLPFSQLYHKKTGSDLIGETMSLVSAVQPLFFCLCLFVVFGNPLGTQATIFT